MRKDVKIGMVIGSVLTAAAVVWVSAHPGLTDLKLPAEPNIQTQQEKPADAGVETAETAPAVDETRQLAEAVIPQENSTPDKTVPAPAELPAPQHKEPERPAHTRIHIVEQGETLSGISQKYYGTASGWQKIYVANRNILSSPDRLRPGMRLVIPD